LGDPSQGAARTADFSLVNTALALNFQSAPDIRQAVELRRVRVVTSALERLLESPVRREGREREAIAEAVARGVDLLELLARDASRRLDGHAPAMLDEAVQSLVDEVARIMAVPTAEGEAATRRGVCIRGPWGQPETVQ
jgi:hypothetical protein